jgi:hypothetical protein
VVLFDHCPSHLTIWVMNMLTAARVCVVTFVPDTTRIFQLLIVTLFWTFKRNGNYDLPFRPFVSTSRFICKFDMNFKMTLATVNVYVALLEIVVEFSMARTPSRGNNAQHSGNERPFCSLSNFCRPGGDIVHLYGWTNWKTQAN